MNIFHSEKARMCSHRKRQLLPIRVLTDLPIEHQAIPHLGSQSINQNHFLESQIINKCHYLWSQIITQDHCLGSQSINQNCYQGSQDS